MRITKYHGILGAFGGGCSILGGVIGWSFANKIPQSITSYDSVNFVLQQNCKLFSYGLIGVGMIGISSYLLLKVDSDTIKAEQEEITEHLEETLEKESKSMEKSLSPLRTGNYYANGFWYNQRLIVAESTAVIKDVFGVSFDTKIEIGNLGKAAPEIAEATCQDLYNIKLNIPNSQF